MLQFGQRYIFRRLLFYILASVKALHGKTQPQTDIASSTHTVYTAPLGLSCLNSTEMF